MSDKFRIIGIHDNHNSAVCLLEDGKVTFAIQEERLSREKNTSAFPFKALEKTLAYNNLNVDDIDLIALGSVHNARRVPKGEYGKAVTSIKRYPIWLFQKSGLYPLYMRTTRAERLEAVKKAGFSTDRVKLIDHHLAHAAAAYYGSHYRINNEQVLVLILDGGGDGLCAAIYIGENSQLNKIAETPAGNSIANLYAATTFYLGFTPLEHEYKLMGMAPYTEKSYSQDLEKELADLIKLDGLVFKRNRRILKFSTASPYSYPALKKIYELRRFDTICAAIQNVTEDLVVKWAKKAIDRTGIHKLVLGGGIFMNVKLNKRIMELPEVEDIYVLPSCGDESTSIGAAYQAYTEHCLQSGGEIHNQPISSLYLGPSFSDSEIQETLRNEDRVRYSRHDNIEEEIARLLAENKIVARFKGRAEWGARALGNRSLLANASNPLIVGELNKAIKMRDFWMPFAPSILKEKESEYIINPKNILAPYMLLTFDVTEKRNDIVAAIHPFDKTARPQVVSKEDNPEYHKLLSYYCDLTGYGGLLNTSFNIHGEPMVCSPEDAFHTLFNSGLQYLAIEDYLVTKESGVSQSDGR